MTHGQLSMQTVEKMPFEIDGIVIKLDEIKMWERLGNTAKSPRWAAAYKFPPDQATTTIEEITVLQYSETID